MGTQGTKIHFKFKNSTTDADVQTGLENIQNIKGVFKTNALFEREQDPVLKLMYFSAINGGVNPQDVVDQIKVLAHIEYAGSPPVRKLL